MNKQKLAINCSCNGAIEGIVWHCKDGSMYKIKIKDFKL